MSYIFGRPTFNDIVSWLLDKEIKEIDWSGRFSSAVLYKIAKDYGQNVFIGIQGGSMALRNMAIEQVREKACNISTEKSTQQWIDGEEFCAILDAKGI